MIKKAILIFAILIASVCNAQTPKTDKTLVSWVSLENTDYLSGTGEPVKPVAERQLSKQVKPVNWARFKGLPSGNQQQSLAGQILLNSAKWGSGWIEKEYKLSEQKDRYLVPNKNNEHVIRPGCSVAAGLAVVIKTGLSRNNPGIIITWEEKELTLRTVRLIKGLAAIHKANGGKWGDHWQSSLWSGLLGRAGWMLWESLDDQAREMVCRVVEYEADRHIRKGYKVPYWNGKGGDSKAEENAWESMVLQQAIFMMPSHPNVTRWKTVCSELMISTNARKSDMELSEPILDGRTPKDWLRGFNVTEDGIIINHNRIHNDYICAIALQMQAFQLCSLAEIPVPETTDFNFEIVYKALVTKRFESPPFKAPGGTMYVPGRPEQYYPEGTDWSIHRFACFYWLDTCAHILGYDKTLPHKAEKWMELRGRKIFKMQSRHADGRMYASGEFDRYPGREQQVLWVLSDAYLLQWLADRKALSSKGNWLEGGDAAEITIDANYPVGNIIVDKIEGNTVALHQELRDTGRWWFYWNFRVSGAAGRTLTFRFTNKNVFGTQGPAVSKDGGMTWSWLGTETVKGTSFSYEFTPDVKSVRFAFSLPYQEADLGRFISRHPGNEHFAVRQLCKTRKNRSVERLHIGKLDGQPKHRVLITCRHHACESTASYVVEGIMDALLAKTDDGKWFRENVEVMVIPFMDKDGVEDGDQGKDRKPRDHCRDYAGKSLYPSVRTLRAFVPEWSDGQLRMAYDFHCPYIRDNKIYQVGSSHPNIWAEQKKFGGILESIIVSSGPMFDSMTVKGDKIIVKFKSIGSALMRAGITGWYDHTIIPLPTHPPGQAIYGFSIAGADGDFRMANARIVGEDTVEVWHPKVPEPKHVRFAWYRNPLHNLYNMEKLPAVPFRTDDFNLLKKTRNRKMK